MNQMEKNERTIISLVELSDEQISKFKNSILIVVDNVEFIRKDIAVQIMKKFANSKTKAKAKFS